MIIEKTITLGYACLPVIDGKKRMFGWENIVHFADCGLYIGKRNGRNRAVGIRMEEEKMSKENCRLLIDSFPRALEENIISVRTDIP